MELVGTMDLINDIMSGNIPRGVPPALAISIAVNGYTEAEARSMIDQDDLADQWIEALRSAGFFGEQEVQVPDRPSPSTGSGEDGGMLLWTMLKSELESDETDFKHRMVVLDNAVKEYQDLEKLCTAKASSFIQHQTSSKTARGMDASSSPRHFCALYHRLMYFPR